MNSSGHGWVVDSRGACQVLTIVLGGVSVMDQAVDSV